MNVSMFKPIYQKMLEWFVKMAWPQIQKLLEAAVVGVVEWMINEVTWLLKNRTMRQNDYAKSKEEDELKKARGAKTADEELLHRKMAEMWRQVADNFREENERLKNDLDILSKNTMEKAKKNVEGLNAGDVFEFKNDETVQLKERLPLLKAGITQRKAVIEAFKSLGGIRNISEIEEYVNDIYGNRWKDFGACIADMVPISHGGNASSTVPEELRVLERVSVGKYRLFINC
jgi:hypothetical protein